MNRGHGSFVEAAGKAIRESIFVRALVSFVRHSCESL